jgi:alpha-1,2-mannosyltransferase
VRHAVQSRARSNSPMVRRLNRIEIIVGLALAALTFDFYLAVRHGFFDLSVYYGAINYWMHDGGSLYDYLLPQNTYGFTYPPFAALTMLPMAITPWTVAIVISCVACVATSVVVIYWLVDPISRREGWVRWFALLVALCFATIFEPLRETFLFGQVNMLLVFLVAADFVLLLGRGRKWAGVGIGLATAIKLTPGIYILYLVITRRWRAAIVASVTASIATVIAAAISPNTSLVFWSDALWNTDRVGALAFISNQSLEGAVARINQADPSTVLWLAAVLVVLAIWFVRSRRAVAAGDEMTGFALTGVVGCLISPVTWVHHLVWVGPAIVLVLDNALANRSRKLFLFALISFGLLCSRIVWSFADNWGNVPFWLLSNTYVWVSIALLVGLPIRQLRPPAADEPGAPGAAAAETRLSHRITVGRGPSRELAELSVGDRTEPNPPD